ncbi:MAG: conjugative relaxase [Rickettsiaceae bacterium]|nr:conjugative relaxase [Rickettsiaceae bacterium]
MLTIKMLQNSGSASDYYKAGDYYVEGSDANSLSYWQGKGAEKLGLTGQVDATKFTELLEGRVDGQQLGRKTKDGFEHKCGWDLTFSAPKSVSILALVGKDKRLLNAVREASDDTIKYIEKKYAITRQAQGGEIISANKKNIVCASFVHTTSRELDPQAHVHNVLLNMVQKEDGTWRSIESKHIYDDSMLLGQIFRSTLASKVVELGYEIEVDQKKGFFEIKYVPLEVRQQYSKRREQIVQIAKAIGVLGSKAMDRINLISRKSKNNVEGKELDNAWNEEAKIHDFKPEELVKQSYLNLEARVKDSTENRIENHGQDKNFYLGVDNTVQVAAKSIFEMEAVCSKQALVSKALAMSIGENSITDIESSVGKLIRDRKIFKSNVPGDSLGVLLTTKEAYRKEQYILKLMEQGKGSKPSIASSNEVDAAIRATDYTKGQLDTIKHIATSRDQIIGVQGYAGTGKTHMLKAVVAILQDKNINITALGSYNSTVKILENELNVKAKTTASFVQEMNKNIKNNHHYVNSCDVWLLDEASQVNANDMADLVTLARQTKARLVLVGDKAQLGAVEWGKPFNLMLKNGLSYTSMDEIIRQNNPELKQAVESAINKDYKKSISHLKEDAYVHTSRDNLIDKLVSDYFSQTDKQIDNSLVIIPDNETRNVVMGKIRDKLIQDGKVKDNNFKTTVLIKAGLNNTEKADARFYQPGQVVEFNKQYQRLDISKDEKLIVTEVRPKHGVVVLGRLDKSDPNSLILDKAKDTIVWNPGVVAGKSKGAIEVYNQQERNIGIGDKLIWTKTVKADNLRNGDKGEVKDIKDDKILISFGAYNKWIDTKTQKNFDYIYAQTAHVAQGLTYDRAFVLAETWRKNLVNQKSFYVAISRAREKTKVYTNDLDKLATSLIHREGEKTSSTESFKSKDFKNENSSILIDKMRDFFSYSSTNLTRKVRSILGKDHTDNIDKPDTKEPLAIEEHNPTQSLNRKPIIDAKEVDVLLKNNVEQVAQQILGKYNKKSGNNMYFGRNKGSLAVTIRGEHQGTWTDFATSENGNLITLIQKHYGLSFKEALEEAAKLVNYIPGEFKQELLKPTKINKNELNDKQKLSIIKAQKLANEAKDIKGTIAERYLKDVRGIDLQDWPKDLRYHDGIYSKINKSKHPALLVIARDKDNKVQSVQAIYLDKDNAIKANVEVQKQTFGPIKGALFAANLGQGDLKAAIICEGPEDALSILKSTTGKDVFACLGKSNFNNLSTDKLVKYDKITLALDNDGQKPGDMPNILNVASRLSYDGKDVVLAQPSIVKQDYNDTLKLNGTKAVESIISSGKSYDDTKIINNIKLDKTNAKIMEKEI